jgi:hypothetical protein
MEDIIKNAKQDKDLFSTINIDELLSQMNQNTIDTIQNKTKIDIDNEILLFFKNKNFSNEQINDYCSRLIDYRIINELYELHKGKPVKIFNLKTGKLKMGGIVCNINILDNGINILCKNANMQSRFMQYKYNDHITFQMLSDEEQLILLINKYLANLTNANT